MEAGAQKQERQNKKVGKKTAGPESSPCSENTTSQRLQSKQEESAEEEEMKQQQRMKIMKDLTQKIRSKGRMDAESRWWVAELLAADCEKAWIHPGWEDTMQKWYEWLEKMKKEDEKEKMEERHQQKVTQMIKSAEGSAGLLHKITKPTAWRGGAQILKNRGRKM